MSMPESSTPFADLLSPQRPIDPTIRILLFSIRRMGAAGLNDAHATHALFTAFGLAYRRPLILVRALMAELSRVARRPIRLAPCCSLRLTYDEANLLTAIGSATERPRGSHARLAKLLDQPD